MHKNGDNNIQILICGGIMSDIRMDESSKFPNPELLKFKSKTLTLCVTLWKVSPKILNSGIILKTFTHVYVWKSRFTAPTPVATKLNFQPYIRRLTAPNENSQLGRQGTRNCVYETLCPHTFACR